MKKDEVLRMIDFNSVHQSQKDKRLFKILTAHLKTRFFYLNVGKPNFSN